MPRKIKETSQFKTDKKRIKGAGRYCWKKHAPMAPIVPFNNQALAKSKHPKILESLLMAASWLNPIFKIKITLIKFLAKKFFPKSIFIEFV